MTPALPEEVDSPVSAEFIRTRWLKYALRGVVLAMVAGAAVFIFSLRGETWNHLRAFRWAFLPVLLAMVAVAWLCNAGRTWLLSGALGVQIPIREALKVTLSTEFAIAATPGGLGGVAMRTGLQKRLGLSTAQTASMMAADVFVDIVFFALLWPFAAVAVHLLLERSHLYTRALSAMERPGPWIALSLVFIALIVGGIFVSRYGRKRNWAAKLRRGIVDFRRNLGVFARSGKLRLVACFLVGALQWTCRYGVLPVVFLAFGVRVDVLPLMLLQGCLFFFSLVIALPGGGGSVELLSGVILPLIAPTAGVGPVVIVWRILTYHLYVLAGGIALWRALRSR